MEDGSYMCRYCQTERLLKLNNSQKKEDDTNKVKKEELITDLIFPWSVYLFTCCSYKRFCFCLADIDQSSCSVERLLHQLG